MAFLKKFPFSKDESPFNTRDSAVNKLLEAEERCRVTNLRLRTLEREELPRWVTSAQDLISSVLEPLEPKLVMTIISSGDHGPGATLTSQGNRVTPYYKYADLPYSVTKGASSYAYAAISSNPRWVEILEDSGRRTELPPPGCPAFQKELMLFKDCVELVESDKITFVPKDGRTDRPIAIGASLNMYLQLGVKAYMEKRLRKVGVDLQCQDKNKLLAYYGSRYAYISGVENPRQFSTIDLASASDTISIELVKLLLPPEWYAFLSDLRHESGILDGEELIYEKFSAMGNGFTFPLESLVFWAIAKAVVLETEPLVKDSDIAVYGDDIIVRLNHAHAVIDALEWSGFSVNTEKSFLKGPFKESCGADFFKGKFVRPFYFKNRIDSHEEVYFTSNAIASKYHILENRGGLNAVYSRLIEFVPKKDRVYAPLGAYTPSPFDLPNLPYFGSYEVSRSGLSIPLSLLSSMGLRPFLTRSEKFNLYKAGLLSKDLLDTLLPMYYLTYYKARSYSGRAAIRLMLALGVNDMAVPFLPKGRDAFRVEAPSSGSVTRRNATKRAVKVAVSLNWNADQPFINQITHPFNSAQWAEAKA
jgi:hypothetical protein